MRKRDFYKKNKNLIIISLIFVIFTIVGSFINKFINFDMVDISAQIDKLSNYYSSDININSIIFENIKEYIRYLGLIGIFSLFFFTFPLAVGIFIFKAISIGYTINTCILLLGFKSIKLCIIIFMKNIILIPVSIILIIMSIEYIKNIFKVLKNKKQDSILFLGKRYLLNLLIVIVISVLVQSLLNIISISIFKFL